jgi:hypothetical protein
MRHLERADSSPRPVIAHADTPLLRMLCVIACALAPAVKWEYLVTEKEHIKELHAYR